MDSDSEGARVIVTDDDVDGALSLAALLRNELPPKVEVIVTHDGLEALERSVENATAVGSGAGPWHARYDWA